MSEPTRVLYNTLEQILSTDWNRSGRLAGKAVQDALIGLTNAVDNAAAPVSAVREGLNATVGAGLSVDVSAGELLRFDPTILVTADDSRYRLAILTATSNEPLTVADPGNPRIDVVSAVETTLDTDNQVRNVLTLPTRVVTPTAVDKLRRGSITITVTDGVAGPTPAFPTPPAGDVALWYVYVPAAAAVVTDGHLMDARQYWRTNDITQFGSGNRTTLQPRVDPASAANLLLPTGQLYISNGGLAHIRASQTYTFNSVVQSGEGTPIVADTEVDHYLVTKGNGVPVGKIEPNGVIPVATGLGTPPESGIPPGGGIVYFPLLSFGLTNVVFTTLKAAYIGSLVSAGGGNYRVSSGSLPLDLGGGMFASAIADHGGFAAKSGLIRPKSVQYVSATEIEVLGSISVVINWVPAFIDNPTWDITADLAAGDAEAADTWFYAYVRTRVDLSSRTTPQRDLVPILSVEAPDANGNKPTPEGGFISEEYVFIGTVYNDSGSDFKPFHNEHGRYLWQTPESMFVGVFATGAGPGGTVTTMTAIIPTKTSKRALIRSNALSTVDPSSMDYIFYHNPSGRWPASGTRIAGIVAFDPSGPAGENSWEVFDFDIGVDASKQFFGQSPSASPPTGTNQITVEQMGYIEAPYISD